MKINDSTEFTMSSQLYLDSLDRDYTRKNGIVYTPVWLASHITTTAFIQWEKFNRGKKATSACDLCCGTGIFIDELLTQIKERCWDTKISAFDIDNNALAIANKFYGSSNNIKKIVNKNVILDLENTSSETNDKYDIIVGNPPYINSSQLDIDYKKIIRSNYLSASDSTFDISVIFIEKALNSLASGGVASLILSNKFMTSKYGKSICEILSKQCNIIKIEDFNDIQIFQGLTTYTCILTFIKAKPAKRHTLVRYFGDIDKNISKLPKSKEITILHEKILTHPWNFYSKDESSIYEKLNNNKLLSIQDVFGDIQQGIRTGSNDIFLINKSEKDLLNCNLVRKFASGENIKNIEITDTDKYVIYPYLIQDNSVHRISEYKLKEEYTSIYNYLINYKETLQKRSLQGNTQWFEFSRSQSLDSVIKPKILIREMMPSAIFSCDILGEFAFSSGYALICENMSKSLILSWTAILSTPTMEFAMRHIGTQLHSGWFRLMKNHLLNLKLPKLSESDISRIQALVTEKYSLKNRTIINEIVANSFELNNDEINYIENYLDNIHKKSHPNKTEEELSKNNQYEPVKLEEYNKFHIDRNNLRQYVTFSPNKIAPIHNWYKYTQGYSYSLVNILLDEHKASQNSIILDPFNGCGTTTVTCAYRGITSIGIEISPLMCDIARIKSKKWSLDNLRNAINKIDEYITKYNSSRNLVFDDYLSKAYSPEILRKIIMIAESIKLIEDSDTRDICTIALLSILEDVSKIRKHGSHYRFLDNSSSVGLQKLNIKVVDDNTDINLIFKKKLEHIYSDLCTTGGNPSGKTDILNCSSLNIPLSENLVDIVITSPPYLNRNNYIAQQKAELDIMGLITSKLEYKNLVKSTFKSHTDSNLDLTLNSTYEEVNTIIKYLVLESGNNPKIPHMICGYFSDLEASLREIYRVLKKGGKVSFIVGNTRWGGVIVPIDHILCKIAEDIGFTIKSIYITRLKGNSPQQMKKFGKISVRESIVNFEKL